MTPNSYSKETLVLGNPCVFRLDIKKKKKFPLVFAWCFHIHHLNHP